MISDAEIEAEIVKKGLTAPRVTLAQIESKIAGEYTFTLSQAIRDAPICPEFGLDRVTLCVLAMNNGFVVIGESACASPENFDAVLGARIARQKAIDKLWALEGYLLRTQLSVAQQMDRDARHLSAKQGETADSR